MAGAMQKTCLDSGISEEHPDLKVLMEGFVYLTRLPDKKVSHQYSKWFKTMSPVVGSFDRIGNCPVDCSVLKEFSRRMVR